MSRYSDKVLDEIKSKLRLSEVVSSYVRIKRQGSTDDYKACCPFHKEKTPSFIVHDDKGFYKCFGCQKSGNMFSFVMEMEHVTFPESIEILAKKANIELKEESEQEKAAANKVKVLSELYNRVIVSFHSILRSKPEAEAARDYVKNRAISDETCDKFMLGFAIDNPDWLYNFLKKNNYSDEILKESGLFSKNYEKLPLFRNRILFPIRNWQGNCVAFSGRDLSGESKAKYVNSPETVLYTKRNLLFGFYESLPELKKREEIILCEGNFDVISLHQAGVSYACAPLGTAFTQEQANLIKRYCSKVNLLFDSDEAGRNATVKAVLLCQKNDLECHVIKPFTNAKDASEMLEKFGSNALWESILNTEPAFSYLVHSAIKLYDTRTPKGKLSVFKEVRPFLDATTSDIERQGYMKNLSEILHVSEEDITNDYLNQRETKQEVEIVNEPDIKIYNPLKISTELNVLLLVFTHRQYFEYFRKKLRINSLTDSDAKTLYTVLEDSQRAKINSDDAILQMIENVSLRNFVSSCFSDGFNNVDNVQGAIDDYINTISLNNLINKRKNIISLINSGEMDNLSPEEYLGLLEAKNTLDHEIEELKKTEDSRI